jgi:hypothetical protein
MKHKILSVVFFAVIFSAISAQEEKARSFSFQINPFIYLFDLVILTDDRDVAQTFGVTVEFEFQYAINNYFNISISPQLFFSDDDRHYSKQTRIVITPGLLFRPFKTRLKGMYIGAYVPIGFENYNYNREEYTYKYEGIYTGYVHTVSSINDNFLELGIGTSIGYQWIFKNGFTLSLGAGGQKIWSIASDNNTGTYTEAENLFKLPFALKLNFGLGYSF